MKHAVEMLYEAAGRPPQPGRLTRESWEKLPAKKRPSTPPGGRCYLTGIEVGETAVPVNARIKDVTWTDHDRAAAPDSEWLSEAAVFSINEAATHPDEPKPFKMRTKTHLVIGNQWRVLPMREKLVMQMVLLAPPVEPWVLAICDAPLSASHILYLAPVNSGVTGEWAVRFGNVSVRSSAAELRPLLEAVEALYTAGHSKQTYRHPASGEVIPGAIETGTYKPSQIAAQGEAEWARLEHIVAPWRGTALFELALFLAQRQPGE